jgi:hypothetical protein
VAGAGRDRGWRGLQETQDHGGVNKARRHAWAQGIAWHGALPPVLVADRRLRGMTCIRLNATAVITHRDKELAESDSKGYGHHPVIAACDTTAEPLAWMLRPGSAGRTLPPITCASCRTRSRHSRRRCAARQ